MFELVKKLFFHNYLLFLPVTAFISAQILKIIIYRIQHGKLDSERIIGAGGMPSSHSAMVCALVVGAGKELSLTSPVFAVCFVLAVIVMYDAMGVRLETGRQAAILNLIMEEFEEIGKKDSQHKPLKELIGHTPFQVLCGAVLGVTLAALVPVI